GTWNQMSIYDDHIRLWNEGVLPEDYTVETLMSKHTSKPRNPKMAQVFYRAGFIEAWGRGYEKIMKALDKANLKRPEFTVEQGGVTAVIYREIFMSVRGDKQPNQNRTKNEQDTRKSSEKGSEKSSEKGSKKTRDRIVCEMKENPSVTINELALMLSISDRAVSKHLKKLQAEGIIRRVGADRGGYWEVINHLS
ncbi:MAG: winged helix-turn-helix transcriptional regulator, partial [Bacteroides sp.]|nr:winged helix-turn-helix transcriptional regulator [Bacteroides sp.]